MHPCRAKGCTVQVGDGLFMCRAHFKALPWRLRWRIWRAGFSNQPSAEWFAAAQACVMYLEQAQRVSSGRYPLLGRLLGRS